jgi:hypothetical protein
LIISHRYKFIFIKTKKTAGTSIEVFLSQQCGQDDIVTPIKPHVDPHQSRNWQGLWNPIPEMLENKDRALSAISMLLFKQSRFYGHMAARTVRSRISRHDWDSYYKFCVERNPWDKTLSHFHMINDRSGGNLTLDAYLKSRQFCINYPLYTDSTGQLLVDKVIRYESLLPDLAAVFEKLGIAFNDSLGIKAKSNHRTDRRPYQEIYTQQQRQLIEKAFAEEIKMFGYTF